VEEGNDEASTDEQDGADASVDTDSVESAVSEIEAKVQKVLKKLESKLKTLDQKLKVISIVTLQGMIETQPDMTEYANQQFYDTRKLEDNPDWYAEDTLLDAYGRSIYQDNTLVAYQTSDPVFQHTESINRVNETIGQLEAELEVLRNELNE
jgi:predicted ribosome quality control (RQC) complex YloA/Tae2 family protein